MKGQETEYDFVKNHSANCQSEFDSDYFRFDSENCPACAATVERIRAENAEPASAESINLWASLGLPMRG